MAGSSVPRLLVLFQGEWEEEALFARKRAGTIVLEREGFELLSKRHMHRLVFFDAQKHADRLCDEYRDRIDAIWSNDDGFGCLLAAVVARRLGLPGNDPAAIVRCQHKALLRQVLAAALPAATVAADPLPFGFSDRRCRSAPALAAAVAGLGRRWPLFIKPVKGVFSALARRVDDAEELSRHLRLPWFDRVLLRGLGRPFEQLAAQFLPLPCPTDRLLLEEPIVGAQVNVDGYVENGVVHVLGIVDEWMYPEEVAGARHFAGFTYPSRHPAAVQERVRATAAAAITAVGFTRGLFNVELFVLADGSVRVIEINPRWAGQFATLYRAVDGVDITGLAIALALGLDTSSVPRSTPVAGAAASFVFRSFQGSMPAPDAAAQRWLAATHPGARLWFEPSRGRALRREYRWFGSHRFAVLNHAAKDFAALLNDGAECGERLFGRRTSPLV